MGMNRKYSALPDLDTAPDIYETPDLTDDNSTLPTTTVRSPSEDESDGEEDSGRGISRSRLRIDQARSHFLPAHVDARDVDFSDRLDGKRKSYKATSRRQKVLEDGTTELGDLSDEDAEDLERKIARLRREVEEAKEECGKQKAEAQQRSAEGDEAALDSLSQALEQLSGETSAISRPGLSTWAPKSKALPIPADEGGDMTGATYTLIYEPAYEQTHALAKAADFDQRLTHLEKALGIGSSTFDELGSNGAPRAVLPTLDALRKQITTLSGASTASLDSMSRRVRTLAQEAEQLEKSRRSAKAAQDALAAAGGASGEEGTAASADDAEQTAKINALYGTLPTIENLAPLLPPLLDRLRSLRAVHSDAAAASEALRRIEQGQADLAGEIKQWREGLEKLEGVMQAGEAAVAKNTTVVEGWVKELEGRAGKLS